MNGQIFEGHLGPLSRHNKAAFNNVAQLSHIAGPGVIRERFHNVFGQRSARQTKRVGQIAVEMIDEQSHIALALAQRRQGDFHRAQAIAQIGTETAFVNKASDILIRCSQKTNVKLVRLGRPKARDALLLNDAQQTYLQIERHFANLVQKQRSTFGRFNLSD